MEQEILLVKIHNRIEQGCSLYDASRGNWKINKSRLPYLKYIIGIDRNVVACVYTITNWVVIEEGIDAGRICFEGVEANSNVFNKVKNSAELFKSKFGRGQSIAYISLINN